jgi:hypothetical protein
MTDLEDSVLRAIHDQQQIADSGEYALNLSVDHLKLVGIIKSLAASELIAVEVGNALFVAWVSGSSKFLNSCTGH